MTDTPQTEDAREADDMGEKPDLGRTPDALNEAMSGINMGSDTRAGSLRGGSASGSEIDPDQETIDESLASEGMVSAAPDTPKDADATNTGDDADDARKGADAEGGEADAATG